MMLAFIAKIDLFTEKPTYYYAILVQPTMYTVILLYNFNLYSKIIGNKISTNFSKCVKMYVIAIMDEYG